MKSSIGRGGFPVSRSCCLPLAGAEREERRLDALEGAPQHGRIIEGSIDDLELGGVPA
nr:hypothetical protein [Protofrankia coriariae]